METVLVNAAAWKPPQEIPDGWLIANAPRPIAGQIHWMGDWLRGRFYAAAPAIPEGTFGWQADDARLIAFTTNDDIKGRLQVKLAEHQTTIEEVGMTWGELALSMNEPWHETGTGL